MSLIFEIDGKIRLFSPIEPGTGTVPKMLKKITALPGGTSSQSKLLKATTDKASYEDRTKSSQNFCQNQQNFDTVYEDR